MKAQRFWARNGWTAWHAIGAIAMAAAAVAVTFDAWKDIFHIARVDAESSQIFLVPVIFAWLIWTRRERLRYCVPSPSIIGPVLVAIGLLVSWWGYRHAVQSFWHGGSVLIVVGSVVSVLGRDAVRRFLPALVVLVFLVPVPNTLRLWIAIPLQRVLAMATENILILMNVPVQRNGMLLVINDYPVAVAEACNGMRMIFALVLVSYAFAFGTPLRGYVRFIVIAASPLSAILCNCIRMVPTVWLYGRVDQPLLGIPGKDVAEAFHDVAGWLMLLVAFGLLMGIIRVLRWALIPVTPYTLAYD